MVDSRIFLGWDQPCLPLAASWLRERYTIHELCDMSGVIVVLPGARAGRRLLELLADHPGPLAPPRIITAGALPELLYESDTPIASPLQTILARTHALRSADRDILHAIIPQPPPDHDLLAWLALARDITKLHEDLAGEALTIDHVIARCRQQADFNDEARWHALSQLHDAYLATLTSRGLHDQHTARAAAIASSSYRCEHDIILIATTDLNRVVRAMLSQVSRRVTSLIHAPSDERDAFDASGCINADHWCDRTIEIPDEMIHIVDRPRDQAMQVLRTIGSPNPPVAAASAARPTTPQTLAGLYRPDEITLGVGDESMTATLHRTLDLAGLPAHSAVGKPITQSRPALLLASLAAFIRQHRLDDFASLLRHPDIEAFLHENQHGLNSALPREDGEVSATLAHWLTLLDRYISEHLLSKSIGDWLGDADQAQRLKAIHDAVLALLPQHIDQRKSLPGWSSEIAAILARVYASFELDPHRPHDADLINAIESIAAALREQASLDPADALTPIVSLADGIAFTLDRLADQLAPPASATIGPAIELLGWLELQLDDAPALIITGFNEHHIPQSSGSDPFLPNHLRQLLGLMDNHRRHARDAAALTSILHSKNFLALVAGRRGHDDEPLKPSRLLLTGESIDLARRILHFYPKDPAASEDVSDQLLLPVGGLNRFLIPAPKPPEKPIDKMHVTWFKTYLDCPYRFYLKHIRRLEEMDDRAFELDGMLFGNLAHEVFKQFGKSAARDSKDDRAITGQLAQLLDTTAANWFGETPPVAMRLQLLQLHDRLAAFAKWQAQQVREGWSILPQHIECSTSTTFGEGAELVTVNGRIDRIDVHTTGRHRIIDYKTGDHGDTPEKTHRQGPKDLKTWKDLQLPLYHRLVKTLEITGEIELGYVLLPKKTEDVGFAQGEWDDDEIADGIATAERVIADIRAGIFWPPREATKYEDEFSAICMEQYKGRDEVLRQMGGAR